MALEGMCGFEYLDTTTLSQFFAVKGNQMTVITTTVKNGTRALNISGASGTLTTVAIGLPNVATRTFGFWFQTPNATGEGRYFLSWADGTPATNANNQINLGLSTTGQIIINRGQNVSGVAGTPIATSTNALASATWAFIEVVTTFDNSAGRVEVFVDNDKTGWIDFTGDTTSTANNYANAIGLGGRNAGGTIDDFYWRSDGQRHGPGAARAYLPDANGALRQWTPSTGTDDFAVIDEVPPNGDTDYLESLIVGDEVTVGYPAVNTTNAILGLQLVGFARMVVSGTVRPIARIGGINYYGDGKVLTASYNYWRQIWETSPATLGEWQEAEIDGAEFGVEHNA